MEYAQIENPVTNPSSRLTGGKEGGFETKAPTITANPIIIEFIGRTISTAAFRFKFGALLVEVRAGHLVVYDLSPPLDHRDNSLLPHLCDLSHRITQIVDASLGPFVQDDDDVLVRLPRQVPPVVDAHVRPEPDA